VDKIISSTEISNIKFLRQYGKTAKEVSQLLGISLNTVNYLTAAHNLLSPELRMKIWRTKSPVKAQLKMKERRLKIRQKIRDLKFDRNLGYIVGCCFGDARVNKPKNHPSASVKLLTRNLSFAKYFFQSCEKLGLVTPRFTEQIYDIKILPNGACYKNILFYDISLNSIDFANFLKLPRNPWALVRG